MCGCVAGCVAQYFDGSETSDEESDNKVSEKELLGYKCVLSSKATEEAMVCTCNSFDFFVCKCCADGAKLNE